MKAYAVLGFTALLFDQCCCSQSGSGRLSPSVINTSSRVCRLVPHRQFRSRLYLKHFETLRFDCVSPVFFVFVLVLLCFLSSEFAVTGVITEALQELKCTTSFQSI